MHSTVLIIPAALRAAANAIAEAMGWGPNSYSVPLSPTGAEPATHYGLHTWASDQFKGWIKGTEPLPPGMEAAKPVIAALISGFAPENSDHFFKVIAEHGLAICEAKHA